MAQLGAAGNPLRVAIIGSGPAGFYTVSNFLKHDDMVVEMDMYERLPTPFGLVRAGVAPDHQKYKTVTRGYDKSANIPTFRFFGNVEYGKHVKLEDLQRHYHQVIFATGAQSDRSLGIPGENLEGSHSATDFVAWYNGHPDYADYQFNLDCEAAAIVGLGNVAVDVARILCKTPDELGATDMADYAVEALRHSRVKTVYILGRRGPAQAAFTPPEIREMGELEDADVHVLKDEAELDALSREAMEASGDRNTPKNVEAIQAFAERESQDKNKQLIIRFLVSPVELIGDDQGRVSAVKIVRNEIFRDDSGRIGARPTQETETLPVGLVFRSVGYRGIPLPEVPFDDSAGVIPNVSGRVTDQHGSVLEGMYVAGWIKRGPSGVIGTNKVDAKDTVQCMVEDAKAGRTFSPEQPGVDEVAAMVRTRQPDLVTYSDWKKIDEVELERGRESNRPRVKFTSVPDFLGVLER